MEGVLRKSGDQEGAIKEEKRAGLSGEEDRFKGKQLESAKAEMGEVREENQRLKRHLNQIMKDYQTLQIQFNDIIGQDSKDSTRNIKAHYTHNQDSELVSLSLGRTSSSNEPKKEGKADDKSKEDRESLSLGPECKFKKLSGTSMKSSPENSVELEKEDHGRDQSWKKTMRSEDDEVSEISQQNPAKRARVSVRVRCDTPTMNDGCQWRKYGQKIAKGNPCPRAYYRCTVASSCPVRKQVQRSSDDMSVLITTYEGTHNHPLPISATAMASTTSAAASMLLSGSSSSNPTSISALHGLHGLKQFYHMTNSSSTSNPTITLDLTTSSSYLNKISSNLVSTTQYPSANITFSSLESNPLPFAWSGTQPYYFGGQKQNPNSHQQTLPQDTIAALPFSWSGIQPYNSHNLGRQNQNPNPHQQTLPHDTISAATKAITSDPSFQSVLAAALKSIIVNGGNGGDQGIGNQIGSSKFGNNSDLGNVITSSSNQNGNKFLSYLNRPPAVTSTQPTGSMLFLQPPLPFAASNRKSTSPSDEDQRL